MAVQLLGWWHGIGIARMCWKNRAGGLYVVQIKSETVWFEIHFSTRNISSEFYGIIPLATVFDKTMLSRQIRRSENAYT